MQAAPALRAAASARGVLVGTALAASHLAADPAYAQVAASQFNSVTPENEMKWEVVEPRRGQFDWSGADAIVTFAEAHGQRIRGHTLVWHQQLPTWLTGGSFSPAELRQLLHEHIATEVGRYRGRVGAWDVVNEPFNDDGSPRSSIWRDALGPDYIAQALTWARQADPAAKLFLNDYEIEGVGAKSTAMLELVRSLRANGVPIDAVGFEGHLIVGQVPPSLQQNIARFTALGVSVELTELDVRVPLPASAADLSRQASDYGRVARECLAVPGCPGITVWGFADRYSWIPRFFPGMGAAAIYDQELRPKPAASALRQAL
jgi:endo-1,4-beta-xylanase